MSIPEGRIKAAYHSSTLSHFMDSKIDMVGYMHIGHGALLLLGAIVVFVLFVGGGAISGDQEAFLISSGIGVVISAILVIMSIPSFLGGWGVLRRRPWSRVLVIILSALGLFNFPIGTAVGAFSIWALTQDEAKESFEYGRLLR